MSQGHRGIPCLISTQSTQSTQEQSRSKGPSQVQGDCSCFPNLPGVGGGGEAQGARLLHLKHGIDVGVLGLHQFPPGGEVAVGEDAPRLQQAKSMALRGTEVGREIREPSGRKGALCGWQMPHPAELPCWWLQTLSLREVLP